MLIPRKVKYRKQHHPGRSGQATGGTKVSFGEFGIQALTPAYVTNRQIESARIAMTRHIKRGGRNAGRPDADRLSMSIARGNPLPPNVLTIGQRSALQIPSCCASNTRSANVRARILRIACPR